MNSFARKASAVIMAGLLLIGIAAIPSKTARADGVYITDDTIFPDHRFREFLLDYFHGDTKPDDADLASVKEFDLSGLNLYSLQGIQYFPNLEVLNCSDNEIKSTTDLGLDPDKNTKLKELNCSNNKFTELSLAFYDDLTALDVRNNKELTSLTVYYTGISDLDLTGCTALETLSCVRNELTGLNIKDCTALEDLDCGLNPLAKLDLSANTGLKIFKCSETALEKLDLSNNTKLESVECVLNPLKELKFGKADQLTSIECSDCELEELELTGLTSLNSLRCQKNPLKSLVLDGCDSLMMLNCSDTDIKDLDLELPKLSVLQCGAETAAESPLEIVDISRCPKVGALKCERVPNIKRMYIGSEWGSIYSVTDFASEKVVKLTPDDWKLGKVDWTGSESAGYTAAKAVFNCTKSGEEWYSRSVDMSVASKKTADPTCTNPGEVTYTATLDAAKARNGKAAEEVTKAKTPKALSHNWSAWETTKQPAVGADGLKVRKCSRCGAEEQQKIASLTPTPAVTVKLNLDKSNLSIVCGKTDTLKATLTGASSAVSWKTSDKKIATVDGSGKIKTKMAGTVTITATAAGKTAECTVTVLYKDVTKSKDFWFAPTNYLTAKGVVKGYDNQTKFKPANKCTRAQMVTFIWRLMGEPAPKAKTCKFKDVKKTDYFYKACIWGNEKKIVEGYKDGTFGPQIVCARRHAVTFLWRLAGNPAPKTKTNKFSDVKKSDYFYKATLWASEENILAGYSDGTFKPNGNCLRRQMVTFLYKYDKFINGKG